MTGVGAIAYDVAICVGCVALGWTADNLLPWKFGWRQSLGLPRMDLVLYSTTLFAIYAAADLHFIPRWLEWALLPPLVVSYILGRGPGGGGPPRRRRLRSSLKRARSWLASGIPARRVTV